MDVLEGYLQNHWTASTAGVSLFRRVARTHGDPRTAAAVGQLADEVAADREALRRIFRSVGCRPSAVGAVAGRIGAELGRLKPNGRILTRSPLTDVLEVEALRDAVFGKRSGWELLRALAADEPRLDVELLEDLLARADRQLDRLRQLHLAIARERVIA